MRSGSWSPGAPPSPMTPHSPLVVVFAHPWEPPTGPARLFPVTAPWHAAGCRLGPGRCQGPLLRPERLDHPECPQCRLRRCPSPDCGRLDPRRSHVLGCLGGRRRGRDPDAGPRHPGLDHPPTPSRGCCPLGIEVVEGVWPLERLRVATEAMALSTIREVQPISQIGEMAFGEGPVTSDLRRAFSQRTG